MLYPVDLNEKYIIYSISDAGVVGKPRDWPRADGMEIQGLDPDLTPLMVAKGTRPAYDDTTHYLESAWVIDLSAEEYRREYTETPLSAEDLAENQEDAEIEAERAQAVAIYQDLKNGTGNSNQRLARVEKVVAHLLRRLYRP